LNGLAPGGRVPQPPTPHPIRPIGPGLPQEAGVSFSRPPLRRSELLEQDDDEAALRAGVRRLLALNAGTLRYIAARLARRGALTGDEVEALVHGRVS